MSKEKALNDIEISSDNEKIKNATKTINKFKKRVLYHKSIRSLSEQEYKDLFILIIQVLEYVGDLSIPMFNIQDQLEKNYNRMYKSSPELAKKLYLEHYHELHRPYNILKNRCFTLLEDMEKYYFKINHKHPPKEF